MNELVTTTCAKEVGYEFKKATYPRCLE
jgi:hypothetical protein